MPGLFSLSYPDGEVILDDFFEIKRVIDRRGNPLEIRYERKPGVGYAVDLATGRFCINGEWIRPAEGDVFLTDRKVEYRPVWFRRWYRTFRIDGGEIDARWILFLGWQFTEDGRNYKRMIQIHQDGTVGVG